MYEQPNHKIVKEVDNIKIFRNLTQRFPWNDSLYIISSDKSLTGTLDELTDYVKEIYKYSISEIHVDLLDITEERGANRDRYDVMVYPIPIPVYGDKNNLSAINQNKPEEELVDNLLLATVATGIVLSSLDDDSETERISSGGGEFSGGGASGSWDSDCSSSDSCDSGSSDSGCSSD